MGRTRQRAVRRTPRRADFERAKTALLALAVGLVGCAVAGGAARALGRLPPDILPLLTVALALACGVAGCAVWWARRLMQRRRLVSVRTLGDLLRLSPTQFEQTVGELLRAQGYRHVTHTGGGGDLAADLTCLTPRGARAVVQCKRYAPGRLVGSAEIQLFIGMITVHHRAERGIFVTTSGFTRPALALAQHHGVQLVDGQRLARSFALAGSFWRAQVAEIA